MCGDEHNGVKRLLACSGALLDRCKQVTVYGISLDQHGRHPQTVNQLLGHNQPVLACDWSGDGNILLTSDAEGAVCMWRRDKMSE